MSWDGIPPELRTLITDVCTPKQVEILKLKAAGVSNRGAARALGVDHSTVRDRLDRALTRVRVAAGEAGIDLGTLR